MRLAVLGESESDDILIGGLVSALLGTSCVPVRPPIRRRDGGWPAVLNAIPAVARGLWYQDLADALVVVCDSDDGPIAAGEARDPGDLRSGHRATILRARLDRVQATLASMPGRPPLRTAVGLAVPAMEAWCLAGRHPDASEARVRLHPSRRDLRREFKSELYGAALTSAAARQRAIRESVARLVVDVGVLDRCFPEGFGCLRRDVESWRFTREPGT